MNNVAGASVVDRFAEKEIVTNASVRDRHKDQDMQRAQFPAGAAAAMKPLSSSSSAAPPSGSLKRPHSEVAAELEIPEEVDGSAFGKSQKRQKRAPEGPCETCDVCKTEDIPAAEIITCHGTASDGTGERHRACKPCFRKHVKTELESGGDIRCMGHPPCGHTWELEDIESHLDREALLGLVSMLKELAHRPRKAKSENKAKAQELAAAAKAPNAALKERAQKLRQLVIEKALTLRCPGCRKAVFDARGCNIWQCDGKGCGVHFCAVCFNFAVGGRNASQLVQQHYKATHLSGPRVSTSGTGDEFAATAVGLCNTELLKRGQRAVRIERAAKVLRDNDTALQNAALAALKQDLTDVGILLEDVRHAIASGTSGTLAIGDVSAGAAPAVTSSANSGSSSSSSSSSSAPSASSEEPKPKERLDVSSSTAAAPGDMPLVGASKSGSKRGRAVVGPSKDGAAGPVDKSGGPSQKRPRTNDLSSHSAVPPVERPKALPPSFGQIAQETAVAALKSAHTGAGYVGESTHDGKQIHRERGRDEAKVDSAKMSGDPYAEAVGGPVERSAGKTGGVPLAAQSGHAVPGDGAQAEVDAEGDQLFKAVRDGNIPHVTRYLAAGGDANKVLPGLSGTLLHAAVANEQKDIITLLIKRGAKVDARDSSGATALHGEVKRKQKAMVSLLLRMGASVDAPDSLGQTALHVGCIADENNYCDLDIVRCLLTAGADVNAERHDHYTPLHVAVSSPDDRAASFRVPRNLAKLLIRKGADRRAGPPLIGDPYDVAGAVLRMYFMNEGLFA